MSKQRGIGFRLTLYVIALILFLSSFIIAISSILTSAEITRQIEEKALMLSRSLAKSLVDRLIMEDWGYIEGLVKSTTIADVVYIFVGDKNGEIVASSNDDYVGLTYPDFMQKEDTLKLLRELLGNPANVATSEVNRIQKIRLTKDLYDPVKKKVMVRNGEKIIDVASRMRAANEVWGFIRIGFSLATLTKSLIRTQAAVFLVSFIALGIGILLSIYLSRAITGPITVLTENARRIAQGDLDVTVAVREKDEIGELAESFNNMAFQLKNSLALIRNIIESMPSMLITVNDKFLVTQWNRAAEEITGVLPAEAFGKNIFTVLPALGQFAASFTDCMEREIPAVFNRQQIAFDTQRLFTIHIFPLEYHEVKGVVLRADDITDIEHKENQLRQAQKMEMVGVLASGLAHNLNNFIGGISGSTAIIDNEFEQRRTLSREEIAEQLDVIDNSTKNAADIVKNLMTLSRKYKSKNDYIDLNDSIKQTVKMCENTFDKSVRIQYVSVVNGCFILADTSLVEQVLLNLCVNGAHAMTIMRGTGEKKGGTLSISLEKTANTDEFRARHPEANAAGYWSVSVKDDGVGMTDELIGKIFDPFFTTKSDGLGSGLGLSTVINIIRDFDGFIDVISAPGLGSTFTVHFPEAEL